VGKSMDTSSATVAGAPSQFHFQPQLFDMRLVRGLSRLNVAEHLLSRNVGHPTAKSLSGAARWITEGWTWNIPHGQRRRTVHGTWGTGDDPVLPKQ